MGYGGYPGGPVDAEADQAGRARLRRLTAMDAHAHPDPAALRPRMGGKGALHFDRGGGTSTGRGEHGKKAVSLRAYLLTAVGGERGSDHFEVLGQSLGIHTVAQAGEQGRGPLDVSEQEGERLRGPSLTPGGQAALVSRGQGLFPAEAQVVVPFANRINGPALARRADRAHQEADHARVAGIRKKYFRSAPGGTT